MGAGQVFLDVDSIKMGDTHRDALRGGIEHAMAVLVLIGPQWLDARSESGSRQLDDPDDFVRQELELALELGKRVVPILVDGAPMPRADDLPASLAGLTKRNALEISHESFASDAGRLVDVLAQLGSTRPVASA